MNEPPSRDLFDEALYLRTFPDIAQAVREGDFTSGYHHWVLHGRFELAAGQRLAGSSFLFDALDVEAGQLASADNPARDVREGASLLAIEPTEAVERAEPFEPASLDNLVPSSERAKRARSERRAESRTAHQHAKLADTLLNAGEFKKAAEAITEAIRAAKPSDIEVLTIATEIFARQRFSPGLLIAKLVQSTLGDAQYSRVITIWTEDCRSGLSEADVEGLLVAVAPDRETVDAPSSDNSASPDSRLCPFLVAALLGSIRLPVALQFRIFDRLQETISQGPRDKLVARVWPVLLPALHDYVGVVSARTVLGELVDFAPLAVDFATLLFREFHEQAVAERLLELAMSLDPMLRTDPTYRLIYIQVLQGRSANYEIGAFLGSIDKAELTTPSLFFAVARVATALASGNPEEFFTALDWLCGLAQKVYEKDARSLPQAVRLLQTEIRRFSDAMIGRAQQRANRGDLAGGRQQRTEVLEHSLELLGRLEDARHLAAASPKAVCHRPKRILVIGSQNLPQCWLYRVQQKTEFLRMAGYDAVAIDFDRVKLSEIFEQLCFASHAIVFRLPAFANVLILMLYAKSLGVKLFYDIDDLIFDERYFPGPLESYSGLIKRDTHTHLAMDNPFFRMAMAAATEVIVPTEPLAEVARELLGPSTRVQVHRNMVALELAAAAASPKRQRVDDKVRIFFGSGTLAHKGEFYGVVVPALARVMAKRPQVELHLVGSFEVPEALARFEKRILVQTSSMAYGAFIDLVREADINIAVTEDSIAVDCKSELKWFEAGIFGIPSVVSPSRNYVDVLIDGKDAVFARTAEDWHQGLLRLIDRPTTRQRIGAAAKKKIEQHYLWQTGTQSLAAILDLDAVPAVTPRRRTRLLFVNVYFWPQSIGGATRILEDSVRYISEHFSDEFELFVVCADENADPSEPYRIEQYWYGETLVTRIGVPHRPWSDHEDPRIEAFVRRFVCEYEIDLAHVHCVQILTASAMKAICDSGVPTIVTVHDAWWLSVFQFLFTSQGELIGPGWAEWAARELAGAEPEQRERLLARRLDLMALLRRASSVLAVSESFAKYYREAGLRTIEVNENGVAELAALPERHARAPGAPLVIGFVGGMSAHKGYELLRKVARGAGFRNLEFVVVDHSLEFESSRRGRWGESRVRFIGRYPQSRVHELYGQFDVLAAPSLWPESFGLVAREALLAGVPVIASDRGDVGRHVSPGINGWVVDVSTPKALHDLLARLDSGEEAIPAVSPERKFRLPADQVEELVARYRDIAVRSKV